MERVRLAALVTALTCFLTAGVVSAQDDKPCHPRRHARLPAVKELTYHAARKRLLAAGWRPLRTKPLDAADTDPDITSGNGPVLWRRGYTELEACSGTGAAACAFLFRDARGNRLRVTTEGEELPKERAHAIVNGFRFLCQ